MLLTGPARRTSLPAPTAARHSSACSTPDHLTASIRSARHLVVFPCGLFSTRRRWPLDIPTATSFLTCSICFVVRCSIVRPPFAIGGDTTRLVVGDCNSTRHLLVRVLFIVTVGVVAVGSTRRLRAYLPWQHSCPPSLHLRGSYRAAASAYLRRSLLNAGARIGGQRGATSLW